MSADLPEKLAALRDQLTGSRFQGEIQRSESSDADATQTMVPLPLNGKPISWPDRPADHRNAAVLFLLYPAVPERSELNLVFIQRPEYDGAHGGQISLPGGRQEPNETLAQTATRETHEEVGVHPDEVTLIGQLGEFYVPASNHNVHPFVGYAPKRPEFVPCEQEVADIIEAPLKTLLDPAARQSEVRNLMRWGDTEVPYFSVNHHKIWGATAIMLKEFLAVLGETIDE